MRMNASSSYCRSLLFVVSCLVLTTCSINTSNTCVVEAVENNKPLTPTARQDLLTGYTLLGNTFHDEAQVKALHFLKRITFSRIVPEVRNTMENIASSASQRKKELLELRKLEPNVIGRPAMKSAIGDAITNAAKAEGMSEMLAWRGGEPRIAFNLRFLILQAQATRMVSAMATAVKKHDVNPKRKKWLGEVAKEYEGYRNDIIQVIRLYIRGQGSAQKSRAFIKEIKNTDSVFNQRR